ncbi:plant UBX domain-containing protein 7 isoform X2 [Jatropha curcas]|uniref:plant UBX domain-containing protein 7 isoform X2 n=1 Tax=Jatropha curcas TaxID=180498 RepID=UPI0005FBF654|nr:plant UBX domain-containing protein 7 isoform X2 [Jatropha curcas]
MEAMLSANDEQNMVSSFLEIAVGQTAETARQFLQATSWKLEEALQLFYVGNDVGPVASASHSPPTENANPWADENAGGVKDDENKNVGQDGGEEVRAPLPVVRDTLYDDAMFYRAYRTGYPPQESGSLIAFRNFEEEMKRPGVWESDQGATSTAENPRDNLASLYSPPFRLMFQGSFEKAKGAASVQDKWLLVNLQSTKEFSSHMVYDDTSEGKKVCTYYKLDSIPVVLVIDPITGQKMRAWSGMIQPESLLEDLVPFLDGGPREHHLTLSHKRPRGSSQAPQKNTASSNATNKEDEEVQRALAASLDGMKDSNVMASDNKGATTAEKGEDTYSIKKPTYPPLPEEPKGDSSLMCRVGLRLPDGRRVQRHFLKTDPVQLLWSFCVSQLEEASRRPFRLTQAIPGAKTLDYESKLTFGESGLANSMMLVAWE